MSAPKLTAAQVRALTNLVVGRALCALQRGSEAPYRKLVSIDYARLEMSEFGQCWAITDAGRVALAAHESEGGK